MVCSPSGVPEILPVVLSNDKPVGKDGCMANEVGLPPDVEGVVDVIVWLRERVMFSVEYVMLETLMSLTVMLIVVDFEPTELLAQIVNTAPAITWVGVPQIVPLLVPKVSPVGRLALIAQVVTPPVVPFVVMVGAAGVIATPFVPKISL